jgi:hypothetical protein
MALHSFRQVFLPYGFRKREQEWEAFNREYSPLGCTIPHLRLSFEDVVSDKERERINESVRSSLARTQKRLDKYMLRIAHTANGAKDTVWLYDDGCYPDRDAKSWQLYQLRLEALCVAGNPDRDTKRLQSILKLLPGALIP